MDTNTQPVPDAKRQKAGRTKGVATIKPEYRKLTSNTTPELPNDDQFEEAGRAEESGKPNKFRKKKGQNKNRDNTQKHEAVRLCPNVLTEKECPHGDNCKYEHDVNKYLKAKVADIDGECPVYKAIGYCPSGIKCRWLGSHAALSKTEIKKPEPGSIEDPEELNRVSHEDIVAMTKRTIDMSEAEDAIKVMEKLDQVRVEESKCELSLEERRDYNAKYFEGRLKPSEKKRLNLAGAKIVSPLTTVGNLPYRRLMKQLGADVTYSEMALSMPLVQGNKSEWALPRMHCSELGGFGVQIAANKPWQATKAALLLAKFAPQTSEFNLNCGCPIDLIFRQGAGSALMDAPGKVLKIIKGMNAMSNDIPVTIKMRTGVKEDKATAMQLIDRLMDEDLVAAVTLHGRSRAQRYAKEADWEYIREVADHMKEKREDMDLKPWIIGNGDIYSWEDWYTHIDDHHVDSCMVARGALVKPWIFEEIESKQYIDKTASERLEYCKQYAKFGLEHWGSDDFGVQQTRRFLCEFLSFTRRYVPTAVLEYLPPKLNDRSEPWKGRNEMEELLASDNYKDWIKVTEMFLGKAPEWFQFEPKHKSNS